MPFATDSVKKLIGLVLSEDARSGVDTRDRRPRTETRQFETELGKLVAAIQYSDPVQYSLRKEDGADYEKLLDLDIPTADGVRKELRQVMDGTLDQKTEAFHDQDWIELWYDTRFAAFFALCTLARLNNDQDKYRTLLDKAKQLKWPTKRGSFYHLRAMYYSVRQLTAAELDRAWRNANKACDMVPDHYGFMHNRAEIAAKRAELIGADATDEELMHRVVQGLNDLSGITGSDEAYAKFWATRARLQLIKKNYNDAEKSVLSALRLERGRWDSPHKRAYYTALLHQIRFRSEAESLEKKIDKKVDDISENVNQSIEKSIDAKRKEFDEDAKKSYKEMRDYVQSAQIRHIEIVAFFVGIITLLAGSMQTIIGAAKSPESATSRNAPLVQLVSNDPNRPPQNAATENAGVKPETNAPSSDSSVSDKPRGEETFATVTALCMLAGTLLIAFAGLGWLIRSESASMGMRSLALVCAGAFIFTLGWLGKTLPMDPELKNAGIRAIIGLAAVSAVAGCVFGYLATRQERNTKNAGGTNSGTDVQDRGLS